MNRRNFLKLLGVSLFVISCGCPMDEKAKAKKFGFSVFSTQEKVCYIDDPNLIGRVLGRNGFGQYRVQWKATSQYTTDWGGGPVQTSPFTVRLHRSWELVSLK